MTTALSRLLAKSKELREAATPGPWIALLMGGPLNPERIDIWQVGNQGMLNEIVVKGNPKRSEGLAEFIAHARNVSESKDEMLAIMEKALEYYSHPDHYEVRETLAGPRQPGVLTEGGVWASDALAKVEEIARGLE